MADWDEAHRLKPQQYYGGRAQQAMIVASEAYKAGDYAAAVTCYSEAIRLEPTTANFQNRANGYYQLKQYEPAIADYAEALRMDTQSAAAYAGRGNCHYELGRRDQAVADWDAAQRLKPNDYYSGQTMLARRAGAAAYAAGDYAAAVTQYSEAIRFQPAATNYKDRADCYLELHQYELAIADYTVAIRMDTQATEALVFRCISYCCLGNCAAVATDARRTLEVSQWKGPNDVYAALVGYFAMRRLQQEEAAREMLDEIVRHAAPDTWPGPIGQYLRGALAAEQLLTLAKDEGQQTEARTYLGLDLILQGNRAAGLQHLRWVAENGTRTYGEHKIAVAVLARNGELLAVR